MKKNKAKNNENKAFYCLSIIFICTLIFSCLFFFGFSLYIYLNAPEFKTDLLYRKESSNIYDSKGDLIATIGNEKRILVDYENIPQVLLDAIIATEDSRFYEHKGVDIYRFIKASLGFLTGNDAGGASTLTMQVSKNTFTSTESRGFDGIIRKFTDIYLSTFKIEEDYSKKEIMEFYVNAPYLGAGTYGVQMASKTYFDKDVKDLNLVEAAMIAGLFQAPGEYDPYVHPEKTNSRKNEVINLMLRHGYINKKQAEEAKKINIESIIRTQSNSINKYQGFIDTVVQEVIDRTGNNPYELSMYIYSTMVRSKQDVINNFYNYHNFKDALVQVGIGVIDNNTGAILAVGAGRNKNSEMSLNYATQIKRHPGSTAKPIFDYGPAIEFNGWGTHTMIADKPVRYTKGGVMHNVDNAYQGLLTLEQCLIRSRNTCALQAFQKVSNSKINSFVTSLGITPEYTGNSTFIHEAHSIGAFTGVSPVELAGAYAAFGNGGYYTEPHSVTKIIYKNSEEEITRDFDFQKEKVMKSTTAYMIAYMLKKATTSAATVRGTDVSVKTGTSSYDEKLLKKMGLSTKVVQDAWTVTFSPNYSIAIWYGYDKLTRSTYNTTSHAWSERTKIQREIVKNIIEQNSRYVKPAGLIYRNGGLAAK